jgi:hypothetical protein
MRQPLYRRLQKLEESSVRALAQSDAEDDEQKAIEIIQLFMSFRGAEPLPHESLREASARALEITVDQLDELLNSDICPIKSYFATKCPDDHAAASL